MFKIKKQLSKLYVTSVLGNLSLTGAWVAILVSRGYSLVATGLLTEHSGICWIMILGGFLAAVGDDFLQVRTNVILQDMFPSQQRATLISIESFSFSLIMIVLSPLAGFFFTYW